MSSAIQEMDAYSQSTFSAFNRLRRLLWMFTWLILCRWTPRPFHKWRAAIMRLFGARIGKDNYIYPDCKVWAPWLLETEDVVTIGPAVEIYNPAGVVLRHHSILSQYAYLCGATHDYDTPAFTYVKKKIVLEPYAWICAKAIVLPGIVCGEGSILGAGSVTARSLEPWTIYAGNPAVKVKMRVNFTLPE